MNKVIEFTLKTSDPVTLEVPIGSKFLNVTTRDSFPIISILTPAEPTLVTRYIVMTVPSNGIFPGKCVNYIGTFTLSQKVPGPSPEVPAMIVSHNMHVFYASELEFKKEAQDAGAEAGRSPLLP